MGSIVSECFKPNNPDTDEGSEKCLADDATSSSQQNPKLSAHFDITDAALDHCTQGKRVQLMMGSSKKNSVPGSYKDFIDLCRQSDEFCDLLTQTINSINMDAFFWECAPVSSETLSCPFEFMLLPAPFLLQSTADARTFDAYIRSLNTVVAFPNTTKDAILVVPTAPSTFQEYNHMSHMSLFLRHASPERTRQLWRVAATTLHHRLEHNSNTFTWMSTNGLDVSWMHIRLDKAPKYYRWLPYKLHAPPPL